MHIEIYVEEPSVEQALINLLPRIIQTEFSYKIFPHQGKMDLLKKLPNRLRAYRNWLPEDWRILVLIDADQEDCYDLKERLDQFARQAGLVPKSDAANDRFQVLNRLAIEELEAWYFGDVEAIHAAYSQVDANLGRRARYRDPDSIRGGTWEALERELKKVGYFQQGLGKIAAAKEISVHMIPERNRSVSFRKFKQGLIELTRA
jgi:hypothetical protein